MPVLKMTFEQKQAISWYSRLFDDRETELYREPEIKIHNIFDCRDDIWKIDPSALSRADSRNISAQTKYNLRVGKNDRDFVKIYGILWNQLSSESREAIAKLPEYPLECAKVRYPFNLWNAIEKTHLTCVSADTRNDKIIAHKVFFGTIQRQN